MRCRGPEVRPRVAGDEVEHRAGIGVIAGAGSEGVVRLVDLAFVPDQHLACRSSFAWMGRSSERDTARVALPRSTE